MTTPETCREMAETIMNSLRVTNPGIQVSRDGNTLTLKEAFETHSVTVSL